MQEEEKKRKYRRKLLPFLSLWEAVGQDDPNSEGLSVAGLKWYIYATFQVA